MRYFVTPKGDDSLIVPLSRRAQRAAPCISNFPFPISNSQLAAAIAAAVSAPFRGYAETFPDAGMIIDNLTRQVGFDILIVDDFYAGGFINQVFAILN